MSGMTGLKSFARRLRHQQTDAEKKLWCLFRNRQCGGYKFRRQVEIGQYIVDLACLEAKLIIEIDGGQHLEQQKSDCHRSRELEARGFRVLRFWNHEVLKEPDAVPESILGALTIPSSPALLPEGEGSEASSVGEKHEDHP